MAIVRVDEIPGARKCSIDEKGVRTYMRVWQVVTNTMLSDSVVARDAPGVPAMFDFYLSDFAVDHDALVVHKEASEDSENPFLWHVNVEYSSAAGDPDQGKENPLDRPPIYKWTTEEARRPAEVDLDGLPVKNSAGMAFDPPPEYDVGFRVLTITRNEAEFDPAALDEYMFKVNSEAFFDYDPGMARMQPIEGEESFENGVEFWKVTYIIKFRTDDNGWKLNPLDQGPCVLVGGKLVVAQDERGQPYNGPVLLNGIGEQLATDIEDPVYLHFRVYDSADFTALNLEPH